MAKIKIIKPVVIRGKLHHKKGAVVEATDAEAKTLTSSGYAENVSATAIVDKSATIDAGQVAAAKASEADK